MRSGDARTGRQVLLIEDSATDARLIRAALAPPFDPACDVEHAKDLHAGLLRLSQQGIDVVLLDLHLPESHGIGTLQRVQAFAPGTPVIVVTGAADGLLPDLVTQHGADLVAKGSPDFVALLRRSMRSMLERVLVLEAMRGQQASFVHASHLSKA